MDQLTKERAEGAVLAPTGTLRVAFFGTNPVHARVDPQTGAMDRPGGQSGGRTGQAQGRPVFA